jgi:hypothetical protein
LSLFSDSVSDSDQKVSSRHVFNIPEPIPAINFPIFFRGKLFPPFFPQVRGEAPKNKKELRTRPAKRTSTRFPKKCNKPRDVLLGGSAGEGAANGDDDDNDDDDDDDGNGNGDGRFLGGSGVTVAAAGAADHEPRQFVAPRVSPRACTYQDFLRE